jgi:hypothetical protein
MLTFLWFCEKMPSFPSIRNVNDRIRSLGSGPVEFWLLVGSLAKQALGSGRKVRVVRTFLVAEVTRGIVGLDASATVNAANSIEKMLSHELAATHAVFMKLVGQMQDGLAAMPDPCRTAVLSGDYGSLNKELCRAGGAIARLCSDN